MKRHMTTVVGKTVVGKTVSADHCFKPARLVITKVDSASAAVLPLIEQHLSEWGAEQRVNAEVAWATDTSA